MNRRGPGAGETPPLSVEAQQFGEEPRVGQPETGGVPKKKRLPVEAPARAPEQVIPPTAELKLSSSEKSPRPQLTSEMVSSRGLENLEEAADTVDAMNAFQEEGSEQT